MKMYSLLLSALIVFCLGCDQSSLRISKKTSTSEAAEEKPLIAKINSPELAKLILKPVRPELKVTRDPFTPLFTTDEDAKTNSTQTAVSSQIEDVIFLGVVRLNEEYSALLQDKGDKGIFRVNDKVKDFMITDIKEEEVTLTNGVRTIKIKRGDNP